jgi:hypothetical protein
MVIEAGCYGNDTKTTWEKFLTTNKVSYFGVWHQEGGKLFDVALKNGGAGNPKYLIRPNKTFSSISNAETALTSAGVKQHTCSVVGVHSHKTNIINDKISVSTINKGSLTLSVKNPGIYTITAVSGNGKQLNSITAQLKTGTNSILLTKTSGIVIVTIKNATSQISKRVVCTE